MVEPDRSEDGPIDAHQEAARAFIRTVSERSLPGLEELYLFGSTARGEATGLDSDVDFLAIVSESADTSAVENELRDVAYDVMLDYGPVVEVHVIDRSRFDTAREREDPFVRQIVREGRSYD